MATTTEVLESNRQLVGSALLLCETFPGAEVVEIPGLIAGWCNTNTPFLNMIQLTTAVTNADDLETRAAALAEYLKAKEKPPLFVVCREWIPESLKDRADGAFARAGLRPLMTLTGMAADELFPARGGETGLEWKEICDGETRNELADINAAAYGISKEQMREALALPEIWAENFRGWVGYLANEATVTAAVMHLNRALHVMCVATLPGHTGRGYGGAAIRHSLEAMSRATGLTRTTLHATEAGRPVYLKMGYRETATFTGYMR